MPANEASIPDWAGHNVPALGQDPKDLFDLILHLILQKFLISGTGEICSEMSCLKI
ncbi:hypothetical protein BDW42DRAFT_181533, partial [Aspergillus taichungensis]